jgi:hypothetical protein
VTMATKHWVRDVNLSRSDGYVSYGNHPEMNTVLFNFLRVAGWEWLWECDGEISSDSRRNPNHLPDGNMESAGVANWTVVGGATRSKVTTPVQSGYQALSVVASAANDGVRSDALLSIDTLSASTGSGAGSMTGPNGRGEMTLTIATSLFTPEDLGSYVTITGSANPSNNGTFRVTGYVSTTQIRLLNPSGGAEIYWVTPPPDYQILIVTKPRYELCFQARNAQTWTVEVDPGTGSFSSIGTVATSGGAYVRHVMSFYRQGSGSVYVRFVASAADTLYLDAAFIFRSYWEYNGGLWSGSDGVITNPDQFSTVSYSLSADDVGWYVILWDPTNNKNSGCYKITAVSLGAATLDLRSGTAALTSASGLNWRLIDLMACAPVGVAVGGDYAQRFSGFGLQSPYTESWRLFLRQNQNAGSNYKGSEVWAAPEPTDFNTSTGAFYKSGHSTQRHREGEYYATTDGTLTNMHFWVGTVPAAAFTTRSWIMTDEDASFVAFVHFDVTNSCHGCLLVGYTGSSAPDFEDFVLLSRWQSCAAVSEIGFDSNARFARDGTTFAPDFMTRIVGALQLGYDGTSQEVESMSNAGANPWSSQEWIRPLILGRDPDFLEGLPAVLNADCGVFQARSNMSSLTTFDSEAYIHFASGLCWEWSGEEII